MGRWRTPAQVPRTMRPLTWQVRIFVRSATLSFWLTFATLTALA